MCLKIKWPWKNVNFVSTLIDYKIESCVGENVEEAAQQRSLLFQMNIEILIRIYPELRIILMVSYQSKNTKIVVRTDFVF